MNGDKEYHTSERRAGQRRKNKKLAKEGKGKGTHFPKWQGGNKGRSLGSVGSGSGANTPLTVHHHRARAPCTSTARSRVAAPSTALDGNSTCAPASLRLRLLALLDDLALDDLCGTPGGAGLSGVADIGVG